MTTTTSASSSYVDPPSKQHHENSPNHVQNANPCPKDNNNGRPNYDTQRENSVRPLRHNQFPRHVIAQKQFRKQAKYPAIYQTNTQEQQQRGQQEQRQEQEQQ